jgi:hypothetical protein
MALRIGVELGTHKPQSSIGLCKEAFSISICSIRAGYLHAVANEPSGIRPLGDTAVSQALGK